VAFFTDTDRTHLTRMRSDFNLPPSLLAAALSFACAAQAQESTAPKAVEKVLIEKVEVKGNADSYDARRDDTASKIVVTRDEIAKYGDTNILDVMKRVPGVTVTGQAGRQGGEVRMRGLGAGYTQVLINGERAPAGFSLDTLAPDSVERIEVLRAASAEYSTQSIAGTINIILKRAVATAQREVKVGWASGRNFRNPNVNLQLADKNARTSYSVAGNLNGTRFYREQAIQEETIDNAGARTMLRDGHNPGLGRSLGFNLTPRINWNLANGDTVTSQSFVNANRFEADDRTRTSTIVGTPPLYSDIALDLKNEVEMLRTDLNWTRKLGNSRTLDVKLGGNVNSTRNEQRRVAVPSLGGDDLNSLIKLHGNEHGLTSTGKYSTPLFEGHSLSTGWDGGYQERSESRVQRETGTAAHNNDESFEAEVTRLAFYVQDEMSLSEHWSLYLGARWEGIETRSVVDDAAGTKTRFSILSPVMQTLFKIPNTKGDQVRFAITRTFKAPTTNQIVARRLSSVNNSAIDPDFAGNPNLKPERALGFDAAYEHYLGMQGALISVSISVRKIEDFIRNDLREMLVNGEQRWVMLPTNGGEATTRGLELEAKLPLKAISVTAPNIDFRASLARNWSNVDSVPGPANRLAEQTPVSATVAFDYKNGALSAGSSYVFRNGGFVRVSGTQATYQSVRRELEAYLLWKFDPKRQLRVTLANVLAEDFVNETYVVRPGIDTSRRTQVFPSPMLVRATWEQKF
jgi:outer membrane receptor for ferrienterochelin and colicin